MADQNPNCPSCGAPVDRRASSCDRCGTAIIKSGGEQAGHAVQSFSDAATSVKGSNAASIAHLSIPLSILLCIFGFPLIPLIVFFIKKDDEFVQEHLKQVWNFGITMCIASIIAMILTVVLIGYLIILFLIVIELVFCIQAAVAAGRGDMYKYPAWCSIPMFR